MAAAAVILAGVALFISLFLAIALVELASRTEPAQQTEAPTEIRMMELADHVRGRPISTFGIAAGFETGLMLVLSPICRTCSQLAERLDGSLPANVCVLLTASSSDALRTWAVEHGLVGPRVIFDDDRRIIDSLELQGSPMVIGIAESKVEYALAISNFEAFQQVQAQMSDYAAGTMRDMQVPSAQTEKR